MKPSTNFGVIFDMDGVLVDSARPHFRSWQLLGEENGTTITEAQFADTFGRHNNDIIPRLFGDVPQARLRSLADRKEELYRGIVRENPPIVEGATELISRLHQTGYRLAVGSSGPIENIRLILSALAPTDIFHAIISGDDVTRGKPDPQVFSMACAQLGLAPSRCVVIEDAPVGIQAAIAAGTASIGVGLYHTLTALRNADCAVEKLADVSVDTIVSLVNGPAQ